MTFRELESLTLVAHAATKEYDYSRTLKSMFMFPDLAKGEYLVYTFTSGSETSLIILGLLFTGSS